MLTLYPPFSPFNPYQNEQTKNETNKENCIIVVGKGFSLSFPFLSLTSFKFHQMTVDFASKPTESLDSILSLESPQLQTVVQPLTLVSQEYRNSQRMPALTALTSTQTVLSETHVHPARNPTTFQTKPGPLGEACEAHCETLCRGYRFCATH